MVGANHEQQGEETGIEGVEAVPPVDETQTVEEAPGPAPEGSAGSGEEGTAEPAALLQAARAEAAEHYERLLRTAAELDNLRKRTARVRGETREETLREVLLRIAPVLDNLTRAQAQQTEDAEALRQGVQLITGQFREVLRGFGLEEIEAVGRPFDPNLHEALLEMPSDAHPAGTVRSEEH
ncbi:MAG: nucleotide exchange factor GrpE, partial [Candidatus Latescibacterota bacterium]